jgi:hypothetical protein
MTSPSSFVVDCVARSDGCGVEVLGVAGFEVELRMEKGSAAGLGGAANEDCMESGGCGVLVDEPECAGVKDEKALYPGIGVEVDDIWPRDVEFWVTEERRAGLVSVAQT